ncbi:type II toxin-antitoxin system RnlB family antitoxin [Ureaplasma ceti]
MKEFVVIDIDSLEYDKLILYLTHESITTYLDKIEQFLSKNPDVKTVLLDQLLVTGNGYNRFIKCKCINGKLDLNTSEIIEPQRNIKFSTMQWLHDNYQYVKNSILTNRQKQNIKDKIVF